MPLAAGRACLAVHEHAPDFTWQRNFQVRGDLVQTDGGWALVPHRLIGGFEIPEGFLGRNLSFVKGHLSYRKTAKRRLAERG